MEKIKDNKYLVILSSLVVVIFGVFTYIDSLLALDNILIFDTMLVYTPTLFYDSVDILNSISSTPYFIYRLLDTFFPFIYGYALYLLLLKQSTSKINYLPFVVIAFDLIENTIIIFLTYVFETRNDIYVYLLNIITVFKFTLILIIIIIILYRLSGLDKYLNNIFKSKA